LGLSHSRNLVRTQGGWRRRIARGFAAYNLRFANGNFGRRWEFMVRLLILSLFWALFSPLASTHACAAQTRAGDAGCRVCFYGPDNIVFDAAGDAYVTDSDHKSRFRVVKISPEGEVVSEWKIFAATGPGKNPGPEGIAIDGEGNIFVTDGGALRVLKVSPAGKALMTIDGGKIPFQSLGHVALDRAGNICVADAEQNAIYKFSPTGKPLAFWKKQRGADLDEWNGPETFAVRTDGTLAIEDWGNRRVDVISPTGKALFTVGSRGSGPGQFKSDSGMAVDSHGDIYVTDWGLHRIQKFDASGHLLSTIPSHASAQFFGEGPAGLSIDKQGNFYTVDGLSIMKFSLEGKVLARWR
jgi:tripartite motif-containing protein 71